MTATTLNHGEMTMTTATERDFERIFVGNRCINVSHFYSIGDDNFAVGYWSHDGIYTTGLVKWHGENFGTVRRAVLQSA